MASNPIWITEAEVTELVSLADALAALETGLRAEGQGKAQNVSKSLGRWPGGGAMHCLGAVMPDAGFAGWKTWASTPVGGAVTYELFDTVSGALLAVIEATALGQMRTASMTGLGTQFLAPTDADTLALIGVGRQALAQVAAIHAVRPLRNVKVFSRDAEKRAAFTGLISESLGVDAMPVESVAAAVAGAAITTLVTRAEEPFLSANMLPPGAHLNAVGAILPTHAEFTDDVFERATFIAVDSVADVRKNSREFIAHFGEGDWSVVRSLGSVIASGEKVSAGHGISLFKALGMGIADLAVATEVYRKALALGVGRQIGEMKLFQVRWA